MKDSEKIKITENDLPQNADGMGDDSKAEWEKLKKPFIYFLMAAACASCLYLIFKPKDSNPIPAGTGFNAAIPQAKDGQLQSDKQKAYEQQLLEQSNEEKRNAVTTLSDYWNDQNGVNFTNNQPNPTISGLQQSDQNALNSYRNAQQTLSSFYGRDDQEVNNLRKEISRLKNEMTQNNAASEGLGMNDQLQLMEKSYQMAAKYLPTTPKQEERALKENDEKPAEKKIKLTPAIPANSNIVSSLYREQSDSVFIAGLNRNRFYATQKDSKNSAPSKNVIKGMVYETKTVVNESTLTIRLIEGMRLGHTEIPRGSLLIAAGKIQGGRLQLKISSIEYKGNIYAVEINVHDNDGQPGLYSPYSPEQNVVSDIVANMSQTSGTNIMMTQSAGQQVAADLSSGVVQGLSGYFQKRVRQLKVTVKAGHQVLLVPKNN